MILAPKPRQDPKDQLALEMRSYHERKGRRKAKAAEGISAAAMRQLATHGSAYDNDAMYGNNRI